MRDPGFSLNAFGEASKYEKLRLWSYETVVDVTKHVEDWMNFYNHDRTHQHLDYETPWSLYRPTSEVIAA